MNTSTNPTISSLLLAVDGSEFAQAATSLVDDLASETTKITILAVLDTPHSLRRQLLLEALQQSQAALQKYERKVLCGLLHGQPANAICEYADRYQPDILILGAKGRRATLGILLGGVAQQVIEYSHQPVLVVRPPYRGLNRIMIVTDGSPSSNYATYFLGSLLHKPKPEVHLVHVMNPYPAYDTTHPPRTWLFGADIFQPPAYPDETGDYWREEAEQYGIRILNEAKRVLISAGVQPELALLNGDAATEILNYMRNQEIDLIVSGSRGLSQVQSWLVGSVSRKLVHYATCSVLVVKANEPTV